MAAVALAGIPVQGKQTVPRAELTAGGKAPDLSGLKPSMIKRWAVDADYVYAAYKPKVALQPKARLMQTYQLQSYQLFRWPVRGFKRLLKGLLKAF